MIIEKNLTIFEKLKSPKKSKLKDLDFIFRRGTYLVDEISGAKIIYVSPSELQPNQIGGYRPLTHTIRIANDLHPKVEEFVRYHE
ncbi:MAG: hypothetical protein AABX28_03575 [Nanoarchaeota archaeon]